MSDATEKSYEIYNTTDERFERDVIDRSELELVIVDFWADWCAPCRMLGPVLEKLAAEYSDRLTLVKADTAKNQRAASQFGVSGIPAVFAVLNGEIVDTFQGALPEEAVRSWIDKALERKQLRDLSALVESAPEEAVTQLRTLIEQSPNAYQAKIQLAQALVALERFDEAKMLIEELEARGFLEPEAEKLKAMLDLKSKSGLDVEQLKEKVAASPDDYGLQLELAQALAGQQRYQEAFEICLSLVANDRKETGEKARELMVEVFRVLPDDSELTSEYRRKLSMALY